MIADLDAPGIPDALRHLGEAPKRSVSMALIVGVT
jgi:hypothetical protein